MISTNQLLRWSREDERIQFFWPGGSSSSIAFEAAPQAQALLRLLERISKTPDNEESLIRELQASSVSNANEILKTLHAQGILKQADGGGAVEAKTYHAFTEREKLRHDLTREDILRLLSKAHNNPPPADLKLPTPTSPQELIDLFRDTRSCHPCVSERISDGQISTLLALAYGRHQTVAQGPENRDVRGTTGSAGAFFPLHLVIKTRDTLNSAPPFGWIYQRQKHGLARTEIDLNATEAYETISKVLSDYGLFFLISIMIDLKWSQVKYGNHAYRFALLEAGALMQNLRIASRRLGLENWPYGAPIGCQLSELLPECREYLHALTIGFGKTADG
ncbi:hypothetical protein U5801_18320 [Lamprobacter modestohalophilus]|uniref:hypothetical protein n=1 Tax=Lamprobacter modestohalophilus TaxID=1064514 RepID=UPI002ADECE9D|nr:hypothetical protein [Lamprobacter modestohalophilus]MEA1051743.1 hypothetical protein [Lamprobacter modestohalophilus]